MMQGNVIGARGCNKYGDALVVNKTLQKLYLAVCFPLFLSFCDLFRDFWSRATELARLVRRLSQRE